MSSARLCSLVAELGYEGAGKLDPDSFEWPFQYDDARPILDWICSSLRPSNVLSLAELSLYVLIPLSFSDSHRMSHFSMLFRFRIRLNLCWFW